jgi:hypothetical protein
VNPKDSLIAGANVLAPLLNSNGFAFEFRNEGLGSGGSFDWGEFVRGEHRLELHVLYSLGLVTYHVGTLHARHETYMKELGVSGRNRYPGFSNEPLDAFRDLAHDLQFATDFLSGTSDTLRSAAQKEAAADQQASKELMRGYVGDIQALEQMQLLFRAGNYKKVLSVFAQLKFPEQLTHVQRRMVEVSRERAR